MFCVWAGRPCSGARRTATAWGTSTRRPVCGVNCPAATNGASPWPWKWPRGCGPSSSSIFRWGGSHHENPGHHSAVDRDGRAGDRAGHPRSGPQGRRRPRSRPRPRPARPKRPSWPTGDRLRAEVQRLEAEQAALEKDLKDLDQRQADARGLREDLTEQWSGRELGFREISGNVRVSARDLESMLKASPLSAGADWRLDAVSPLLDTGYFPDIDDIAGMAGVFFDEIERGGQVSLRDGEFVGRGRPRNHRPHFPDGQVHHRLSGRRGNGIPGLVPRGSAAVRPGRAAAAVGAAFAGQVSGRRSPTWFRWT